MYKELTALYRNDCPDCASLSDSKASAGFSLADSVMDIVLKRLLAGGLDVKNGIDPDLFKHTRQALDKAADAGFGKPAPGSQDDDFLHALKYNNAVFAAFKTHRQQNDLFNLMTGDDGELKPFHLFKKEVEPIIGGYNSHWLRTEYDTAVKSSRTAAEWKQYEREADLYPNVEWLPSMAVNPREAHKPYYHIVRKWNDAWWNTHYPGCLWGCQCGSSNTAAPVNVEQSKDVELKPDKGLEKNPAFTGSIFSEKHPYRKQAYKGAEEAVDDFMKTLEEK